MAAGVLQDAVGNAYGGLSGSEYYFDVPSFVSTINRMNSRPGATIGRKGGNHLTEHTYGMAFIRTGGYITWVGRDNNQVLSGWIVPTDGGYSRIYTITKAFIAVKDNGEVSCWGLTSSFGNTFCPDNQGQTVANYPKPIRHIYSGTSAWCAHYTDTTVFCWKDGTQSVDSPPGAGWVTITMGGTNSYCALKADGSIFYEGVTGVGAPPADSFTVLVVAINTMFVALSDDGTISIWPSPAYPVPAGKGYTAIRPGYTSFSALKADGSVTCWGVAAHIVNCPTDTGYVAITATGQNTAYAGLKADGTVSIWGHTTYGGTYPTSAGYPTLANVVKVYSSNGAFAARKTDGSLACWGNMVDGGATVSNGATACPTGVGFTEVYATYTGFAALDPDGAIFTWVMIVS